MSGAALRIVQPRLPLLARLRARLSRRYYRCQNCRALAVRRLRGAPGEYHFTPCDEHKGHRCGRWERVHPGSFCAQRYRLMPLSERARLMRDN